MKLLRKIASITDGLVCQRCYHTRGVHRHYRKGTDCSADCMCPKFTLR